MADELKPIGWIYDNKGTSRLAEVYMHGPNRPDGRHSWKPLYRAPALPAPATVSVPVALVDRIIVLMESAVAVGMQSHHPDGGDTANRAAYRDCVIALNAARDQEGKSLHQRMREAGYTRRPSPRAPEDE